MNTQGRKSPPVRRSGRSDAGKRRPGSGVGSRLLIMAAIVAAVIFGVAIFFKVNTVEVQGNAIYSAEEIRSASGIQKGDNLFTLNKEAAAGSIKASLPYVETVSIIRFLPDKIVIEVKESDATFAVTTDTNTTWLINSVGKALEQISDSAPDSALTAEPTAPDAAALRYSGHRGQGYGCRSLCRGQLGYSGGRQTHPAHPRRDGQQPDGGQRRNGDEPGLAQRGPRGDRGAGRDGTSRPYRVDQHGKGV